MASRACATLGPDHVAVAGLATTLSERFGAAVSIVKGGEGTGLSIHARETSVLASLSRYLFWEAGCAFGGLIVEERAEEWILRYLFLMPGAGWAQALLSLPLEPRTVPSISAQVHAADWYEREAEDLFGLHFEGHPRLGDFVLHDQVWQEALAPMRRAFDARAPLDRRPQKDWRPLLVVQDPGAFAMPVGPVYEGGIAETAHFLLETVGEDVVRAVPRLFYKHRAVEKIAEGRPVSDVLLLAERFAGTCAFAHSLAFCQAVERAATLEVPPRAIALRVALSELERLRHHIGTIEAICQSTALSVSEAHAAILEEELLRACGHFTGHRYLFGLNTPGGLSRDFDPEACAALLRAVDGATGELRRLEDRLRFSSSFLDRLEEVGIVSPAAARDLDLVGPVGRASGRALDWRQACPYSGYGRYRFQIAGEQEGDGYARLRVLFFEAQQSAALIRHALEAAGPGAVCAPLVDAPVAAAAAGWVEAPIGGTMHWVRLDGGGRVERYRILSPSFRNWLGFHVAVENFAFQDFPIILATFGLSVAECDR
jgi:formate hydrogenlyase subunit 5